MEQEKVWHPQGVNAWRWVVFSGKGVPLYAPGARSRLHRNASGKTEKEHFSLRVADFV